MQKIIILGIIVSTLLVGCNTPENAQEAIETVTNAEEILQTEELIQTEEIEETQGVEVEVIKTESESILAEEETKPEIYISEKAYDGLTAVNDKYIIFRENGNYGVIDFEENVILPAAYVRLWPLNTNGKYYVFEENGKYGVVDIAGSIVLPAEYDYCDNELENGMSKFSKVVQDGFESVLYDADMNVLFKNADYPQHDIISYNENILCLKNTDWTSVIYLDGVKDFEEIITLNNSVVNGFTYASNFHNDYATLHSQFYYKDKSYANLIDKQGNILCLGTGKYDILTPWSGQYINNDGWTICQLWDNETESVVVDTDQMQKIYFYNVKTRELVDCIPGSVYVQLEEKNGISFEVEVVDGYIVGTDELVEGKRGYILEYTSDDKREKYVYDIENQSYMTTEPYSYISLEKRNGTYLYSNMEGKWGYLDEAFKPVGGLYEDASAFCNGYAAVNENGEEYIIDSNFEKITEAIPGNSAYENSYFIGISEEGKYRFVVVR